MSLVEESVAIALATNSTVMQRTIDALLMVASTEAQVMLLAELGTEPDRLARFVHDNSGRRYQPFLALSCPSMTELPAAIANGTNGGTLFLEEVGELAPRLVEDVEKRSFRNDLFFHLNVVEIRVPSLRERRGDILPLTRGLVDSLSAEIGRRIPSLSQEAASLLLRHSWPGNLRELKNVIERALLIWLGDILEPEAFTGIETADAFLRPRVGNNVTLRDLEREHILRILTRVRDRKDAAAILGIAETTLWRRRKLYDRASRSEESSVKKD